MEPELGLGIVISQAARRVKLFFPASNIIREYMQDAAPIKRVEFGAGETISTREGQRLTVDSIDEVDGLLVYNCAGRAVPESELSDVLSTSSPHKRLLKGRLDTPGLFELRRQALQYQQSFAEFKGLLGGRISLIPHQLYIAHEVSQRQLPRVLLADEVGLGKTIEACLILHRLLISGRINRVLIMVPDALLHQWLVELLRRFNLTFKIFSDEYAAQADGNPFLEDQLYLASPNLLCGDPRYAQAVLEAGWDMLIVDEAHHIEEGSAAYELVRQLSQRTPRLLLLTATPEQAGEEKHFARLRLLDEARFFNFEAFKSDNSQLGSMATLARKLIDGIPMTEAEMDSISDIIIPEQRPALAEGILEADDKDELLGDLLDRHGPGRVIFRNTRAAIKGFPRRIACLHALDAPAELLTKLRHEFRDDMQPQGTAYDLSGDPRVRQLASMLREGQDKILLICRTRQKALAIEAALMKEIRVKCALFHEDMSILQRDRNAAWFAEEDGAQLLICSEIGSEGRNFQFAHQLFLFDLPPDPELLEQRIGRLDRIGQTKEIQLHIPFIKGSAQEAFVRWYHEALDAFESHLPCGEALFSEFGASIQEVAISDSGARLEKLIEQSRSRREQLSSELESGRDRLLEMGSCRPDLARDISRTIHAIDSNSALEEFMLKVFDYFSIEAEPAGPRSYILTPDEQLIDAFPFVKADGMTITFDRAQATAREEVDFLTWDHPMVSGAIELLLGTQKGSACLALLPSKEQPAVILEAVFALECIGQLDAGRFLPDYPLSICIDHAENEIEAEFRSSDLKLPAENITPILTRKLKKLLPKMVKQACESAEAQLEEIVAAATARMQHELEHELKRLQSLARVNPLISAAELEAAAAEIEQFTAQLSETRCRLDSVRVIFRGAL